MDSGALTAMVWNHGRDIAVDGFVTVVDGAYVLKNFGRCKY